MIVRFYRDDTELTIANCQPISLELKHNTDAETVELSFSSRYIFENGVRVGDYINIPTFPEDEDGQPYRIYALSTDGEIATANAKHITFDFANAYFTTYTKTGNISQIVADLNAKIGTALYNNRGIRFGVFVHDAVDGRYAISHELTLSCKGGDDALSHLLTILRCNIIRDNNLLVLTYGTPSDYFRNKYSLPEYSAIYKKGRNVFGYSSEDNNTDLLTAIIVTGKAYYSGVDRVIYVGRVLNTEYNNLYGVDECLKHCRTKEYSSDLQKGDDETEAAFNTRLLADYMRQAQEEIDSYSITTQNITIEAAIRPNEQLFGGEICICADEYTQSEFSLMVLSFTYDCILKQYNDIQLGRITASLSELGGGGSGASASSGGINSVIVTDIYRAINVVNTNKVDKSGDTVDGSLVVEGNLIGHSTSQMQKELLVGNAGATNNSLQLYDVRNGQTYSNTKNRNGYVTLPWGMILAWGRTTVQFDGTQTSKQIAFPVKIATPYSVVASVIGVNSVAFVNHSTVNGASEAFPNGYFSVMAYTDDGDGNIAPYNGSLQIAYQIIGV